MSLHRLTAGSGYDYLTRQVAAMDSTEKGHVGLASYYTEKGETPGVWVGSGLVGIDGLAAGDAVTAEQMQALFGSGLHPLSRQRIADLGSKATPERVAAVSELGRPFSVLADDVSPFRVEVARRLAGLNTASGVPRRAAVAIAERARIRSEVGTEMFGEAFGRAPLDERELAGFIARESRQKTRAVAGFDLTFSPVKSVSALWAVADQATAAAIERAHNAAVADALAFIERRALFTREGRGGVRQVEVRGLVATAFTHRDSRAGDPDLHTHVAVANKVQTVEGGRWLAIDGRVLFKAIVAASETYNTALERHLAETLGVRFAARPDPDPRKRPVREIVGVDPALNERWSTRRVSIDARRRQLAAQFQADHHRPPTPTEAIALAQQATLETRQAKHEPRSLAEQRQAWRAQAEQVLGGDIGVRAMIRAALHPAAGIVVTVDAGWVRNAAVLVLERVQQDRSTWQDWHVRGEALRLVRAAAVPSSRVDQVVDQVVAEALGRCRRLDRTERDEPAEPGPLRRSDGSSVYRVAGSQVFTTDQVLAAEVRLVEAAGLRDGKVLPATAVDLALLECQANGVELNAGQVLLVRDMATSGARVQLAIAPAGSGKTTAMNALSRAWTEAGGTVIGLAPSAAAAAGLGDQMTGHTDTLAKLVWTLQHDEPAPEWMRSLGPDSLVIIDEAGMADTLSLDVVVQHVLARGGSVRLIGDDQQLAAIGAGGVLRDIQTTHGALHLRELVRFTDRAEGSASLALREGHNEALGFYLDQGRIHVGDQTTMADELFAAWSADVAAGADSIMLAPTRDLVAELNERARNQRLAGHTPDQQLTLSSGNTASVGDVIITRRNNRTLRITPTSWVKNGDRWTIVGITARHELDVRHTQTGRQVRLPADYAAEHVDLGYACTTHTAQGVTADSMHGLLTGTESRQQAYTMLTRGRHTNHAYVVVVGDGDPHSVIRPDTINPLTPTDVLEHILARDESPLSATTQLRDAGNPALRLGPAAARYADAVAFAAAHHAGQTRVAALEQMVNTVLPGLVGEDTWPALRGQLLLAQANGHDPYRCLADAAADPLTAAQDPCSVLAWRVATREGLHRGGPVPWLPAVPTVLADHPLWGAYLEGRAQLVTTLADQVRATSLTNPTVPAWAVHLTRRPGADLIADVEVWRAATGTPISDLRPLGAPQHGQAEARWQRHLRTRLADSQSAALTEWGNALDTCGPQVLTDPFAPTLAARLAQLSSSGLPARHLLDAAAGEGPLPDDHAAAALWWRLARRLAPTVADATLGDHHLADSWLPDLDRHVGLHTSLHLRDSTWWPALVTTIERGLQRGWPLTQLLDDVATLDADGHTDLCQAWVWRLSLLTDHHDQPDIDDPHTQPPADLYDNWTPPPHSDATATPTDDWHLAEAPDDPDQPTTTGDPDNEPVDDEQILGMEALLRRHLGAPEPTDADLRSQLARADAWRDCPVPPERLLQVNHLTADFYAACLPGSWAQPYLADRFGVDLTGHPTLRPGYAPDTWTALVTHLRRHGISDHEMLLAGVASTASTGRLIDRFRNRAVFPIVHDGQILGFVGRRHPDRTDTDNAGPKYLNTPETPLFHKGDQLFLAGTLTPTTTPVIVEGPMDAIAVSLATEGRLVGAAPLGTSLTEPQVAQLHTHPTQPIVATDADPAGRAAAAKDFWLLALYNLDPRYAQLPDGSDPASLVADQRHDALLDALHHARPLADTLIDDRLTTLPPAEAILEAARVVAAQPPTRWTDNAEHIAAHTRVPISLVRSALASMARGWNANPRRATQQALAEAANLARKQAAAATPDTVGEAGYETVTTPTPPNRPHPRVDQPPPAPSPRW